MEELCRFMNTQSIHFQVNHMLDQKNEKKVCEVVLSKTDGQEQNFILDIKHINIRKPSRTYKRFHSTRAYKLFTWNLLQLIKHVKS